jgi:hypothetical protein
MIKALLLIFGPMSTWDGIARARRSLAFVLGLYLLPMLLIVAVVDGYGLVHWGKWQGEIGRLKLFPVREAVVVVTVELLLSVAIIFVGAKMLKSIGETFHGRHTYAQALTTVVYGLSPLFLLRLLDAFSWVSPWVSWSIGISLSVAILYHGVPRMLEPDPPHAFGLFLMSSLLLVLISGLVRFATAAYLQGKFSKLQVIISDLAAHLPF